MPERISYVTSDGVTVVGDWVAAPTTIGAAMLLHMMPATRASWRDMQTVLAKRGIASLAIDLRGHGESTQIEGDAPLDYRTFKDDEHQTALYDVIGAFEWLRERGFDTQQIVVAGASIGANLAIQMLLEEPQLAGAVLLSPGKDYNGTNAVFDAPSVLPDQAVWVAASEGDDQESFETAGAVYTGVTSDRKTFVPLKNAGHGTGMLTTHPELLDAIADWLKGAIQRS